MSESVSAVSNVCLTGFLPKHTVTTQECSTRGNKKPRWKFQPDGIIQDFYSHHSLNPEGAKQTPPSSIGLVW